jgi:hypothetical protein
MRYGILGWLLLIVAQCVYGDDELRLTAQADSLRGVLVSAHNRAFGKDFIFKKPLTFVEKKDWADAWHAVGKFVMERGASEQKKMWSGYQSAYDELMMYIERTFFMLQSGGLQGQYGFDLSKGPLFGKSITFLEESIRQQKKESYFLQASKVTRIMLEHAAVMLITTMQKVAREITAI